MKTNTYLNRLIERQRAEGWSDREMGRQLGLGSTTWYRIKRGQRGITVHFLRHAMERFPEYNTIALFYLAESATVRSTPEQEAA